jgi:hypothetical protein
MLTFKQLLMDSPLNIPRFVNIMQKCQAPFVRLLSLLILLFLLLLCNSCKMLQLSTFPKPTAHTQAYAEQLFINGDFESALLEFEQIYDTALSLEDKNQALYGLACTQMMLARNDDQLIEAIGNLEKWDANKGSEPFWENRHLLMLSLKEQSEIIAEKSKARTIEENQKNALIANQQVKIAQMTSTAEQQQKQIEKLQNQIAEIEAIDQNVQEKRKPL